MELRKIKKLIELVKESGITELEITEGDEKLKIGNSKVTNIQLANNTDFEQFTQRRINDNNDFGQNINSSNLEKKDSIDDSYDKKYDEKDILKSPLVGTFYRAPSPNSPSYVEIGQKVEPGQVLCIVEAMKLMNEIESDRSGTIVDILVNNSEPVEYGDPLFVIK